MTTTITSTGVTFNDSSTQTTQGVEFPSGTLMLFQQTAAPTGWTKQTSHNNKALRVVSGTASSGGSVAFTSAFAASLSAGATTLSSSMIPSHSHTLNSTSRYDIGYDGPLDGEGSDHASARDGVIENRTTSSEGGGGSHTHSLPSFDVQYVDLIIAAKN